METKEKEIKAMLTSAVHFGHKVSKWNPKMKPYLYGEKNGIHIFNLETTYDLLGESLKVLEKTVKEGKVILFVSTKQQAERLVRDTAVECGMPYITKKWMGGLLTNFSTIKRRIKRLKTLKEQEASGEIEKYTKKEVSSMKKEAEKLESALGGVQNITRPPDMLFVVDSVRDNIAIREARRLKIPVMSIADSNSNPDHIDYFIPGNDDAVKSLTYFLERIKNSIKTAKGSKK